MAFAIIITNGRGPSSKACHELLVKKLGNVAYFPIHPVYQVYTLPRVNNEEESIELPYSASKMIA